MKLPKSYVKSITLSIYSYISVTAYSVIPLMVYVFPLLVCPYAKMLAGEIIHPLKIPQVEVVKEYKKIENKDKKIYSQLIPLRTERAISLAPSSYTCFVGQFCPNTLSIINPLTKGEKG